VKSIKAFAAVVVAVAAMFLTSACGDSETSPEPVVFAVIQIAVVPDPVAPTESTNPDYAQHASFAVLLTETGGTGTSIGSISVDVKETLDGAEVEPEEDVTYQADVNPESDRIEGGSTTRISFDIYYTLPGEGTEARVHIRLPMIDDYGNVVGGVLQVQVSEPEEEEEEGT
jgi:hypothetical protein